LQYIAGFFTNIKFPDVAFALNKSSGICWPC
jgi:hypothetical protein